MAGKRKNGEGSYGEKIIKGTKYKYYRFSNGKYIYAKTSKELNEKIKITQEKEEEELKLTLNPNGKLTVGEFANNWLKSKRSTVKPKTYDGYEFNINIINDNRFMFGSMQIKNVEKKQIQNFLNELTEYYARNTILKTRTLLNQIFDEAVENNLIIKNPVIKTKVPLEENVKKDTREIIILEKEDINKFIKEAERINGEDDITPTGKIGTYVYGNAAKMAIFILNTGLRASEAVGLQWDCVDIENKIIKIKRADTYIKNRNENSEIKYKLNTGTPKSKSGIRTIPLTDKAVEILKYFENNKNSKYVFTTANGTQILHSNLNKTIRRILKHANCKVQSCGAHALRHTFASQLIAEGVDIQVISKLLGHSKVSTTYDIYIHLLEKQDEKAIETLNNIFNTLK